MTHALGGDAVTVAPALTGNVSSETETYTLLGQWLEEVRISRRQTQWKACLAAGITEATWRRIVNGHTDVRIHVARKLARYLDVTPEIVYLLADLPADAGFEPFSRAELAVAREEDGPPLPIETFVGTKWHPTVAVGWATTCRTCPFVESCQADVNRGDFAWCEALSPIDLDVAARVTPRRRQSRAANQDPCTDEEEDEL